MSDLPEAPASPARVLTMEESLQVEIVSLKTQLHGEMKKALEYKQAILDLQKENVGLRAQLLEKENEQTFLKMGVFGEVKLNKQQDGKYRVEPDPKGKPRTTRGENLLEGLK